MQLADKGAFFAALKNADDMLKALVRFVDSNGDGKIQYEGPSR